eukprot:scaffold2224_cov261-Pinguiococcus_pyrenoidosus.AAC.21
MDCANACTAQPNSFTPPQFQTSGQRCPCSQLQIQIQNIFKLYISNYVEFASISGLIPLCFPEIAAQLQLISLAGGILRRHQNIPRLPTSTLVPHRRRPISWQISIPVKSRIGALSWARGGGSGPAASGRKCVSTMRGLQREKTGKDGRKRSAPSYNPISRWKEETVIEGLTLYDIHRKPRLPTAEEDVVVEVVNDRIIPDLQCHFCLDILDDPVIVMECLHRFCNNCIQKHLRVGKQNECFCKTHIPSRRSLRQDLNFKNLICKLYPNLQEFKRKQERYIQIGNRRLMNQGYAHAANKGMEYQKQQRVRLRKNGGRPDALEHSPSGGASKRSRDGTTEAEHERATSPGKKQRVIDANEPVAFVLRRHPNERAVESLPREYLRTSSALLVRHIKQYLGKKLHYKASDLFEIIVRSGNKAVVLDDSFSLFDILQHFWQRASDLVLHFRISPTT